MKNLEKQLRLYYYTGTGNTLCVEKHLAALASEQNMESDWIPVDRLKKADLKKPEDNSLTGICYPTHGFNAPWHIIKFCFRLPRKRKAGVFLLNTRGGSKIGKYRLPGMSGIALLLPALILFLRGFKIRGLCSADPPSNWLSIHPPWKPKQAEYIMERALKQSSTFFHKIQTKKCVIRTGTMLTWPLDLSISWISVLYFLKGRFLLGKMYMAGHKCTSCGLCEKQCPVGAIKMVNKKPYWTFDCESCMRCLNICPEKCIQASHSIFGALLAAVVASGITIYLAKLTLFNDFMVANQENFGSVLSFCLQFTFDLAVFFPVLFFVYGFIHYLMLIKPFRYLFEYTSLTKYWGHYLAPGIGKKDLKPRK
jgi:ferredoxin